MDNTKEMQDSDHTVLPAVVGGLVAILLELRDEWQDYNKWLHALSHGFISFCTAYYLVPALLAYLTHYYGSALLTNVNIISLAGFIGGLLGSKIINVIIYIYDKYSKRMAEKALNKIVKLSESDD